MKNLPKEARPREKLLSNGPQALADIELLALLLRTGTEGKGVLMLAEELLAAPPSGFGGLSGLLNASVSDLKKVKGLGPAKLAEMLAVIEIARRTLAHELQNRPVLNQPSAVSRYFQLHLSHLKHEVFGVMFLNTQLELIAFEQLFQGTLNQTSVHPREVLVKTLAHNASAVILVHNHPSGNITPSAADISLTQTLQTALKLIDVRVLDHVIVAKGQTLSMNEKGLMR